MIAVMFKLTEWYLFHVLLTVFSIFKPRAVHVRMNTCVAPAGMMIDDHLERARIDAEVFSNRSLLRLTGISTILWIRRNHCTFNDDASNHSQDL
jgi:hypothetical protein